MFQHNLMRNLDKLLEHFLLPLLVNVLKFYLYKVVTIPQVQILIEIKSGFQFMFSILELMEFTKASIYKGSDS